MPLYKYLLGDRLDILEGGMIRFTPPMALNDPFEVRPFFDAIAPDADIAKEMRGPTWDAARRRALREAYEGLAPQVRAQLPWRKYLLLIQTTPSLVAKWREDP